LFVEIGTDGRRDWVVLPDGTKYNLGTVSVLKFVQTLERSQRAVHSIITEFLAEGKSGFIVRDEAAMWQLIRPPMNYRRRR